MEETLIKAFNCADSLPRCCFIWHLKVGRAALQSSPWARCSPWGGKGTDRGFHLPLFPGTLAFNESCSCSSTANLFSGFGEREGKGSVVLFKQQQKNPTYSPRQLKSSLINGPVVLARRSQVPFHLAPAGPINPLSHFASHVQRAPISGWELRCGSCLGRERATTKARRKTQRGEGWQRGTREARCQQHCSTTKWNHFTHLKGERFAHASVTQACKVHFQQESSKLTQAWQHQAILPHLECTVSSSSFSKHLSELFLQVKLHRSKEKSGNRTRRSIETPHLIKHPIHNCLH